jgi:integrase
MLTLHVRPKSRAKTARDAFRLLLERTEARVSAGVRSPATLQMQREHVRYLLERLPASMPLERLTPRRIVRLLQHEARGRRRPLSANSLRKRASTLSQALELARGRAPELPEIPYRYDPRVEHLADFESYQRLRDALPYERRLWFVAHVWTGQRRSDVDRMVKEDLDIERSQVRIRSTKTKREPKWFHAAPELLRELADHVRELPAGARLVPRWPNPSKQLEKLCEELGLPRMSPQKLRHTFFTWYVGANGFTAELLELGGWKDLTIPARVYAHAAPKRLKEQIERTHRMLVGQRRTPRKTRESETGTNLVGSPPKQVGPVGAPPPTGPAPAHGDHADRGQERIVVPPNGESHRVELVGPVGFEPTADGLKVPLRSCVVTPGRPWKTTERDHANPKTT